MHPDDLARPDEGSHLGLRRQRIADLQPAGALGQPFAELGHDRGMREDPLHRHADLAGVVEAALCQRGHRGREVGIGGDDHRGRATMLEGTARARRQAGAQAPADPGAADEAEEAEARIGHQLPGNLVALERQGLAPVFRQAGLAQDSTRRKHDSGVALAGLMITGQPAAIAGAT